jgi:alginate O-acetyltransferase complex protein AlgI
MVFNSGAFAIFFVVVYALYVLTLRRVRLQNALLLGASYVFYGWWDWRFLGLLAFTSAVDFVAGLLLECPSADLRRGPSEPAVDVRLARIRRAVLGCSLLANLGVLAFFKYFNFFTDSAAQALETLGLTVHTASLNVILPVGISFYTFQSMSYTIDVYRGSIRAERNPIHFALFISFFPQLVAGPIVRAANMLPQLNQPRPLTSDGLVDGCFVFFRGLFKKVVVADNLARLVDRVFASENPAGVEVLIGVYAFAFQIYADFSGYSDMARGLGRWMGFEIPVNFRQPYFAANPSDFWRRWHNSLSTWLRDYLYVALGGNRRGRLRTGLNLLVTMVLGGLWHGAAWTFVAWGAFHGAVLVIHRSLFRHHPQIAATGESSSTIRRLLKALGYFHVVCAGWLLFRAGSIEQAVAMFASLLNLPDWFGTAKFDETAQLALSTAALIAPILLMETVQEFRPDLNTATKWPRWIRGTSYACALYAFLLFGAQGHRPFIYFQF